MRGRSEVVNTYAVTRPSHDLPWSYPHAKDKCMLLVLYTGKVSLSNTSGKKNKGVFLVRFLMIFKWLGAWSPVLRDRHSMGSHCLAIQPQSCSVEKSISCQFNWSLFCWDWTSGTNNDFCKTYSREGAFLYTNEIAIKWYLQIVAVLAWIQTSDLEGNNSITI